MTQPQNHPFLERAGIEVEWLTDEFNQLMVGTVPAPELTFQFDDKGRIGETTTPLCEDAPAIFRERFIQRWTAAGRNGEACWERLRELVERSLHNLPDNPFTQEKAWLVGLVAEIPPRFEAMLPMMQARLAEYRAAKERWAEIVNRAKATGERQVLETWLTEECTKGNRQCSFDHATKYVLPNGKTKTEFKCCH